MAANDITFDRIAMEDPGVAERWRVVRDAVGGDQALYEYLPHLNPRDTSAENNERNAAYRKRAVYYNAVAHTLAGLLGLVFRRDPRTELPAKLAYLLDNADGNKVSLFQQSQQVLSSVLQFGRVGLYIDVDEATNRPILKTYAPESIVNWNVGAKGLDLVVLAETAYEREGYGWNKIQQYRELYLDGGVFLCQVWRKGKKDWERFGPAIVPSVQGKALDRIPFQFVGSVNNDPGIDSVPLYPLARLNIAHYRNSADYEDSCFMHGQPQAFISGLTEEWRDYLEKNGVYVGSRSALLLPQGGSYGFAQAQANSMVAEAMRHKEAQMVALGARLLDQAAARTATQSENEREASTSVLSLCASNVTEAYQDVIGLCADWMGVAMSEDARHGTFKLTQDFARLKIDPASIGAVVAAWQAGVFAKRDLREYLRAEGLIAAERSDDEIEDDLSVEGPALGAIGAGE